MQRTSPPRRRLGRTGPLLVAFVGSLAGLALCGALVIFLLADGGMPGARGPAWTPAPVSPIPEDAEAAKTPSPAELAPGALDFQIGQPLKNASGSPVRLRRTPGHIDKPANDILTTVPAGGAVTVAGGPQLADELIWWEVQYDDLQGWMAQASPGGVILLEPVE